MKLFNHLKEDHLQSGMSMLEVIAAIGILAIFGTSIFLTQEYLFGRVAMAQKKTIAAIRLQGELVDYQEKILEEFLANQGQVEKSTGPQSKNFALPDMTVQISTKTKFDQPDFKGCVDLYLITAQAIEDKNEYARSYRFTCIPKVTKK